MITRFDILFKVLVNHTYYLDRVCPDLEVLPSRDCRHRLGKFGLLTRPVANGRLVAFEAEDAIRTPRVKIEGNKVFTFLLKQKNPSFENFTTLTSKDPSEIYYYDNLGGTTMALQTVKLRPSLFKYPYESTTKNINLSLTNVWGDKVYDKDLSADSKKFNHEVDARTWTPGLYELKIKAGTTVKVAEKIYISDEIVQSGCFGIVEIFQKGTVQLDYSAEQDYRIEFSAKTTPWKYIIELTKDFSSHLFKIEDKENYATPPDEPNYPYTSEIKFVEVGATTHQKGERAEFVTGTSPSSKVNVPLSEIPKKKLQLTVSNGTGQLVVKDLPNPTVNSTKSEVYLRI